MGLNEYAATIAGEVAALREDAERWRWLVRHARPVEEIAADRYRVVRGAFWWRVAIGDGQQTVGRCHIKAEAERLAAALRTAFLDGAFVVAQRNTIFDLDDLEPCTGQHNPCMSDSDGACTPCGRLSRLYRP